MFNLLLATNLSQARIFSYIILIIYVLIMVGIAYYCRTRKNGNLNDFFLAGRGMGGWMTAFAYGTTYFSAVIFIGYAGKLGWNFGFATLWIGIGNALLGSYLAWKFLAEKTRTITHRLNVSTMPEFFAKRYNDKYIKLASSLIIFMFLIPYSASVYQGLGYLFQLVFNIPFNWVVIIMATVTALYVFFGGYLATVLSDFVQGIIMLVGVFIMVILVLNNVHWGEGIKKAGEMSGHFFPSMGIPEGKTVLDSPFVMITSLFLLTSLGIWGLPQSVHKFYAIKDKKEINKAKIVSTVFAGLIGLGAYLVGTFGKYILKGNLPGGKFDMIMPEVLVKTMPPMILGIIAILVLSASMSSLSALTLSSSSAVSVDLYKGYIKKNATDKQVKILLRVLCLVFVLLSAVFAIAQPGIIITLMSLSWGTLAGCFLGPYLWGLYSKKITRAGAWASLASGILVTFLLIFVFGALFPQPNKNIFLSGLSRSPIIGTITMIVSLIITPVVSLFTKKVDEETLYNVFEKEIEEK